MGHTPLHPLTGAWRRVLPAAFNLGFTGLGIFYRAGQSVYPTALKAWKVVSSGAFSGALLRNRSGRSGLTRKATARTPEFNDMLRP